MSLLGLVERAYYLFHRRGDVVEALASRMPPGDSPPEVLDFGGGTGRVSRALAARRSGRFTVADIDPVPLARAAGRPSLRPLLVPEEGPLPFAAGTFDCILLVDVLHHVRDAEATLAELTRSLRPGGRILVVDFDATRLAARVMRGLAAFRRRPCRLWSPDELVRVLSRAGLATRVDRVDALRFLVDGRRPDQPAWSVAPLARASSRPIRGHQARASEAPRSMGCLE